MSDYEVEFVYNGPPALLPDVRLYSNAGRPVPLCLSHVVERRRHGASVELLSEKVASKARCKDCQEECNAKA